MSKKVLGLDLSLTSTGYVLLEQGEIIEKECIKSKPSGEYPIDELRRILAIVAEIEEISAKHEIALVVIENLAFGVKNATSLTQLSGLNYFIRKLFFDNKIPFVLVAPTTLKKFVTGSGNSKKDVMMIETFKRYGVTLLNDNENDAFGLAKIGEAILVKGQEPQTTFQKEVVELIKKQLI